MIFAESILMEHKYDLMFTEAIGSLYLNEGEGDPKDRDKLTKMLAEFKVEFDNLSKDNKNAKRSRITSLISFGLLIVAGGVSIAGLLPISSLIFTISAINSLIGMLFALKAEKEIRVSLADKYMKKTEALLKKNKDPKVLKELENLKKLLGKYIK